MSTALKSAAYPAVMDRKLQQVRRRQSTLAVVRALLLGAATLSAGMLLAMAIDGALTIHSSAARCVLTILALAAPVAIFVIAGGLPGAAARGMHRAARDIDRATPLLEERWTTVENLVGPSLNGANSLPRSAIGRAMLQQVTSEAVAMGQLVEPARIAGPNRLRWAGLLCAIAVFILSAFLGLNWPRNSILLQRFWKPLTEITATQLEAITGDLIVPRGDPAEIVIRMSGLPRDRARLALASVGAPEETMELLRESERAASFTYRIAAVGSSFRYRAEAGDGQTDWNTVTVIDRPAIAEVKVTLTAPDYAQRPVYQKTHLPANLQAMQGSRLRLEMRPEATLKSFAMRLSHRDVDSDNSELPADEEETLLLSAENDGWYRYEMVLERDVTIVPELCGPHGLRNDIAPKCSIRVVPDRPPTARVIAPGEGDVVMPDQLVEVKFEAHDDHGISRAELVVYAESPIADEPPTVLSVEEIPLGDQENSLHVRATAKIDLADYGLRDGARISFAIRVADNRPLSPDAGREENSTSATRSSARDNDHTTPADSAHNVVDADTDRRSETLRKSDRESVPRSDARGENDNRQEGDPTESEPSAVANDGRTPQPLKSANNAARDAKQSIAASPANPIQESTDDTPSTNVAGAPDTKSKDVGPDAPPAQSARTPDVSASQKPAEKETARVPQPGDEPSATSDQPDAAERRPTMTDDMPGRFTESNRLQLKIVQKVVAAAPPEPGPETSKIELRRRLTELDEALKPAEESLSALVLAAAKTGIADPQIRELNDVDQILSRADESIAELRRESQETPYAFAGLYLVEIGTTHIAPARDRIFALIRQPDVDPHANLAEALHGVTRARELLARLLVRFEQVQQEERLADSIEQMAKIYEVYVKNLHKVLREQTEPTQNPLKRKMEIVEVDQAYLDRLREVTEMRRDLMAEFARMVGDDPRLLSKYIDLIRRRQTSLRDRLTELRTRQETIATELSGWRRVDPDRRDDVWMLAAELRLQDVTPFAHETARLEDRTRAQFPLVLDPSDPEAAAVTEVVKQLAVSARSASVKARRLLRGPLDESLHLGADFEQVEHLLAELEATLAKLAFRRPSEETTAFVDKRLAESRTLSERVAAWVEIAGHLEARRFTGLVQVDQSELAFRTEVLRIEMSDIDQQFSAQFRGNVPPSLTELTGELKQLMESITFNQFAATFELQAERPAEAEAQQALAVERFQQAEELFDRIRRLVIEELDQLPAQNPNIADLRDPTLDEVLRRLEREPDLNALLGLPNRPRNLRVISDFFTSNDGDTQLSTALDEAAENARKRGEEEQKSRRPGEGEPRDEDKTEEEWREIADAEEAREKLQQTIEELQKRAAETGLDPEAAEKLRQMARQLEEMQKQLGDRQIDKQEWEAMARSDQMQAILRAAARGEPLPATQWNRLMSTLGDGLWQVRRRTPPEGHRRAIEQYQERLRRLTNREGEHGRP